VETRSCPYCGRYSLQGTRSIFLQAVRSRSFIPEAIPKSLRGRHGGNRIGKTVPRKTNVSIPRRALCFDHISPITALIEKNLPGMARLAPMLPATTPAARCIKTSARACRKAAGASDFAKVESRRTRGIILQHLRARSFFRPHGAEKKWPPRRRRRRRSNNFILP